MAKDGVFWNGEGGFYEVYFGGKRIGSVSGRHAKESDELRKDAWDIYKKYKNDLQAIEEKRQAKETTEKNKGSFEAAVEGQRQKEKQKPESESPKKNKGRFSNSIKSFFKARGQLKNGKASDYNAGTAYWWMFLAFLLWFYDIITRSFNGIDIDYFLSNFSASSFLGLLKASASLILIIGFIVYFFKRPDMREFQAEMFLIVAMIIIIILGKNNFSAILHILIALMIYLLFAYPFAKDKASITWICLALVLFDFFGFGLIEKYTGNVAVANRILVPIWFYFVLIFAYAKQKTRFATILVFAAIILNVFYFTGGVMKVSTGEYYTEYAKFSELDIGKLEQAKEFFPKTWESFKEQMYIILWDPIACAATIGAGGYNSCLTDRIDQRHPERKISVNSEINRKITEVTRIDFIKPKNFPSKVYKKENIRIPMIVNISSPLKEININMGCKFRKGNKNITGTLTIPEFIEEKSIKEKEDFAFKGKRVITVTCTPDLKEGDKYEKGTYNAVFWAKASGIETSSELKRLFVGNMLEMSEKEKTDLLNLKGYKAEEPSNAPKEFASFSFGIGTPAKTPLLDDSPEQHISGGFENLEKGTIIELKSLRINLPEEVTLKQKCGDKTFITEGNTLVLEKESIEKENEILKNIKIEKGKTESFLECELVIGDLLKNPQTTGSTGEEMKEMFLERKFSAVLGYSYYIEQGVNFELQTSS